LLALKAIYEDDVFVNEGEDLPKDYADRQPREDSKNRAVEISVFSCII
jgi:hypothetical protein